MLISHKWITALAGIDASPEDLAERLTFSGLEVEGVDKVGEGFDKIVIAEVKSKKPHPERDNLHVVEVFAGEGTFQVVCGAPNCPGPGGLVLLAMPGARIGDFQIESRNFKGIESHGMLCSEQELDIGVEHEGIFIVNGETDAKPGTPIADALDLKDTILDLSVTPNRPDALSHRGVAREAALLYNLPFNPQNREAATESGAPIDDLARVEILDSTACPRYGAAVVTGVGVKKSPFSVRYRLHNLGVRAISNLVDMTNWIVLEWGQPLHAFDLDELARRKIIVRKAGEGEKIVTLDEIERSLTVEDLLICDGERPVAVAGVMGGLDTGVTESTKNILIECAYFEPSGIRRTSKRLKLASESSYRFERGIDPSMAPDVLSAASAMTVELAGGAKAPGIIDCYPKPIEQKQVVLRPARYSKLVGSSVPSDEMKRILEGLGSSVVESGEDLKVSVPLSRPDIEREVDLIEEVARVRGYEEINPSLPRLLCRAPKRPDFETMRKAKELLASLGLSEAINYSFVTESLLKTLSLDKDTVRMANPLNAERATMRTTLVAGLLENLARSLSRFLPGLKQFEVARTFHDIGEELPLEVPRAAAVLSGPADAWVGSEARRLDFFDAKGLVEAFVLEFAGQKATFKPNENIEYLHPRRACEVIVSDKVVGNLGEIHPDVLESLKLPRGVCAFELALDSLAALSARSQAQPLIEYPPITRDVALLVDDTLDAGPIAEALAAECGPLAREITLFDIYRGKGIPDTKRSLAYSVVYQSGERTLTDDEVDSIHKEAVAKILSLFGAVQR